MDKIVEYRGIRGLVGAEVLADNGDEITFGTPFPIAGTSELSKETDSSSEAHYYDNIPGVVIDSVGSDTIGVNVSAVPLSVISKITGQKYDEATGTLIEGVAIAPYLAIGYITDDTDGNEVFVWRMKGKFARPGSTHATKDNGTGANGQTLNYTGISTTHKFVANDNKGASGINCPSATCGKTESEFFAKVQTPDDIITANAQG